MSFVSRNGGNSTNPAVKLDEDNVTITVEDGSLPDEHEQDIEASDYDDSYMGAGDESPRLMDNVHLLLNSSSIIFSELKI